MGTAIAICTQTGGAGAPPWEKKLLVWAYEGLHSHLDAPAGSQGAPERDQHLLASAYEHCSVLTATHSHTFYLASGLLPGLKRLATRALYAFCRIADDIVDRGGDERAAQLRAWRSQTMAWPPEPTSARPLTDSIPGSELAAMAWADARARFSVPLRYAEQLIDGVASDITHTRYATFEELAAYCYQVASTVGLMAMHITGFSDARAIPYAVKLGVALQLTNILRDVGEDWRSGRLYLPLEELAAFGLSEADIAAGQVHARWQAFMRFQIERARQLYTEAMPGIRMLDRDGRFAIAAAAGLYQAILDDIAAHAMDVFGRRAHVGAWGKLRRLPGLWRQTV